MARPSDSHPYIRRVSFLLTERCPIRCRHCVYACGPSTDWAADMLATDVLDWMAQAVGVGIREFCFTGGEPFLVNDTLRRAVIQAAELGAAAGVITNAFWAVNEGRAYKKLEPLHTLQELSISADRFHQEHIPFGHVRHAIAAARAIGIPPRVKIAYENDQEITTLQNTLADLLSPDEIDADRLNNVGRMSTQETPASSQPDKMFNQGCPMTRVLTVVPNGGVYGCCGPIVTLDNDHPLRLGNLRNQTLSQILQTAEFNLVYQLIRVRGIRALDQLIADQATSTLDVSSPCSLCYGLLGRRQINALLGTKADDARLFRQIAVERLLYFSESFMLANVESYKPGHLTRTQ